ncbi:MAG: hypothetical protein WBE72_11270 [Terracidiphilus sp.]
MWSTGSFEVRAFDCHFRLAAGCAEAHAILDRYVFPSLPRLAANPGHADLDIRIEQSAGAFQLLVNGEQAASAGAGSELVRDLVRVLDEAVIQRLGSLRAVHAGAVLWNGRVVLLPGSTHAGKSSLVAELLRRGATYFSDEYAMVDAQGRVHPYPRPLLVRNGRPEQVPLLAEECNAAVGDAPAPVGWIFSLEYRSESAWNVVPVPQSVALLTLLQNTPHPLADSPEMVGAFQHAVAGARCFAGIRNDAVDAAAQILRLIA